MTQMKCEIVTGVLMGTFIGVFMYLINDFLLNLEKGGRSYF